MRWLLPFILLFFVGDANAQLHTNPCCTTVQATETDSAWVYTTATIDSARYNKTTKVLRAWPKTTVDSVVGKCFEPYVVTLDQHALSLETTSNAVDTVNASITHCGGVEAPQAVATGTSRNEAVFTAASSAKRVVVTAVGAGSAYLYVTSDGGGGDSALVTVTAGGCVGGPLVMCPGDDVAAKVTAAANGATITFSAGTYMNQSITPKTNQTLIGPAFVGGAPAAILDGSRTLTSWTQSGSNYYAANQTQQNTNFNPNYSCQPGHDGCFQPEQLWVNDSLYEVVTSLAAIGTRKWFFDYTADRIYLPFNPADSVVKTSVTRLALQGSATGVTIKRLAVKYYANEAQNGVVNSNAANWTIDSTEVGWNHGTGIEVGANGKGRWNHVHHQGQMGMKAFGQNPLVEGNLIEFNNTAYFGPGVYGEAGGTKFVGTTGLIVRDNHARHNDGPGLWTDIDNDQCLYEGNRVDSNKWRGIFHEISQSCIIRDNVVIGNGNDFPGTLGAFEGAGILISNSGPNVEVYNNFLSGNRNGIFAREEDRGAGYNNASLYIHDNCVHQSNGNRAGGISDTDPNYDPYAAAANNIWSSNDYVLSGGSDFRWSQNVDYTQAQWLAIPQDAGATFGTCTQAGMGL
jgi:parallel beta-helix repeat protein